MKKIAIPNFTDDESEPFWWDKFASDIGYLDIQEYQYDEYVIFIILYDEYAKILTDKANDILLEYNATFELSPMADPSAICDYAVVTFKDEAKYNWFLLKYT